VSVRTHAYLTSALLLAAVLYPALLDPGADSFPLSTYPMFARERPRRVEVMSALALGAAMPDGSASERAVPPSYIANAEAMQALQTLRKSVQAGRRSARKLCERIARELAAQAEPRFADAREIALVTTRVDALRFLQDPDHAGEREIERRDRTVHVRCAVPGRVPARVPIRAPSGAREAAP